MGLVQDRTAWECFLSPTHARQLAIVERSGVGQAHTHLLVLNIKIANSPWEQGALYIKFLIQSMHKFSYPQTKKSSKKNS